MVCAAGAPRTAATADRRVRIRRHTGPRRPDWPFAESASSLDCHRPRLAPRQSRTSEAQPPTGLPLILTFVSRRPVTFRAATPCPETPPKAESDTCTGPIGWSGKPSRLSAFRLRPQVKPEKLRSRKVGR